jgi:outer membrane beta-barrel protein
MQTVSPLSLVFCRRVLVVLVAVLLPVAGHAEPQDDPPAAADNPAAEPPAPEPKDNKPKDEAKPDAKPGVGTAEKAPDIGAPGGLDLYGKVEDEGVPIGSRLEWAQRRQIRTVQKRAVLKEGRIGVSGIVGIVPNDDFFIYLAPGLGVHYYLSEDVALNVHGAYTCLTLGQEGSHCGRQTLLETSLEKERPYGPGLEVRLPERLEGYFSLGIDWNLLHGKIGYFTTRLIEFDGVLTFGGGLVSTWREDLSKFPERASPGPSGNAGAAVQFYLTESLALRLDFHQFFYFKYRGGVSHPIAVGLALTWLSKGAE